MTDQIPVGTALSMLFIGVVVGVIVAHIWPDD